MLTRTSDYQIIKRKLDVKANANLSINGNMTSPVVILTAASTLGKAKHAGRTMSLQLLAGFATTLPKATGSGDKFKFVVGLVNTSGSYIVKVGNTTDIIQGSVMTVSDGAAAVLGYNTAGTSDTVTLNGTTTGGLTIGDWFEITDLKDGVFTFTGLTSSSGTEATPFSATV